MLSLLPIVGLLLLSSLSVWAETPLDGKAKVIALIFISSECPISNRMAPEIERLHRKLSTNGASIYTVYPNPTDTDEIIRRHRLEYRLSVPFVRDPAHELTRKAGVRVTPEAAVFDQKRSIVYSGRINDQFIALGKARPEPTTHDLEEALQAALESRKPKRARLPAVGCYIEDK